VPGSKRDDIRGPWPKGIDNRRNDQHVPDDALRNAVNVELTFVGALRRRDGYTSIASGQYHSLWSENDVALVVKNNVLTAINPVSLGETAVLSGLSPGSRMAYLWTSLGVYFSNGLITGRYVDYALRTWGVEHASGQPRLSAIATGGLDAGRYMVAITYLTADGEEGGTTTAVAVDVASGGGIRAAAIPQPASSFVTHIAVYVSMCNGELLYHHTTVADGTTTLDIARSSTLGRELSTQFLYPMPACSVIEEYNGRLYAAVGNQLWFSEPYFYGQRRATNYVLFPEPITIVSRAGTAGLHVVSDQHYLLRGEGPESFTQTPLVNQRGVKGTLVKMSDGITRTWVTDSGMVVSPGDGTLESRLGDRLHIDEATEGSVLLKEQDGEEHIVASLRDGVQSAAVAGDFVDAEVIRRS
jgi:hypothetical protein